MDTEDISTEGSEGSEGNTGLQSRACETGVANGAKDTKERPTPRTDSETIYCDANPAHPWVYADFARQLETELAEAIREGEKWKRKFNLSEYARKKEMDYGIHRLPLRGGWLFGVNPDLEIPGYSVVMSPETFVQAVRANGVPHFVVETPGGWLLHPKMCKAEFRSAGNPEGEYVNTQIGLYVPRPE